ncbi:unnamed protein product [Sphagnum balticum]
MEKEGGVDFPPNSSFHGPSGSVKLQFVARKETGKHDIAVVRTRNHLVASAVPVVVVAQSVSGLEKATEDERRAGCLLVALLPCLLGCTVDGSMTPPHAPTPYALLPFRSLPVYLSVHIHLVQRRAFKEHPLNKRCSKTLLVSRRHGLTIFIHS